jgi:hypothetical protein
MTPRLFSAFCRHLRGAFLTAVTPRVSGPSRIRITPQRLIDTTCGAGARTH